MGVHGHAGAPFQANGPSRTASHGKPVRGHRSPLTVLAYRAAQKNATNPSQRPQGPVRRVGGPGCAGAGNEPHLCRSSMGYKPNRGSEPDEREDGHHGYRVQANGLKHRSLLAPGRMLFLNRLSLAMVEIALAPARQRPRHPQHSGCRGPAVHRPGSKPRGEVSNR